MGEKAVSISTVIAAMKPGEEVSFPLERLRSVRVLSSDCGLRLGRNYSTRSNREARTVTVRRTK